MSGIYLVSGTLAHDGNEYQDGQSFSSDDEALIKLLVKNGVLLLPEQYAVAQAAEGNAAPMRGLVEERQSLADENAQLRAELDVLKAAREQQQQQGQGEPPKSDEDSSEEQ